ncbi:SART3 (predicted) [Pycnogonum litorale]
MVVCSCLNQIDLCVFNSNVGYVFIHFSDNAELLELRSAFQNAVDQIKMCFPSDGDPSCIIQQYWARLEARHLRNMEKVRQIWTEIMACGNGKYAHMWLEYANIERSFGDVEHERKVLQRGVQSASDWPETIIDMLMNLERDVGTLEQWDHAVVRCEAQIKRVEGRRLKAAEKEALIQKSESDKKKRNRFEKKSTKFQQDTRDTASKHHNKFEEKSSPKKGDNEYSKAKKRPPPPGYKREQPDEKKIKKSDTEDKTEEQTFHDNDKTVFLSNLAYMLDEETIKDFFRSVGTVADLRLVKDFHGRSRGYAYLEFQTTTEAEMALKMDRQLINGRPVFVSRCQSEKLKSDRRKFKYNTDIEKNKLFIKGLSFATTQKDLEETFEKYGKLKEVRLVTYRSGKSKGLAYVDYEDEADAAKALVTTDGMTIHDKVISVDISNPPQRKNQQEDDEQTSALMTIRNSLGRGTTDLGSRGKGRTNVSLLPRALQNKLQSSSVTSDSTNGSASSEPTKKLSNADFRSMLLSKK